MKSQVSSNRHLLFWKGHHLTERLGTIDEDQPEFSEELRKWTMNWKGQVFLKAWSNVTHFIFRLSAMRAKVGGESCGSFMVGHRKQKSILVAAVLIAVFLIALYFNSRPKPFKPFTALIVSTTHAQSNTAGHESLDKGNLKYQMYNNSVQFDHVSRLRFR